MVNQAGRADAVRGGSDRGADSDAWIGTGRSVVETVASHSDVIERALILETGREIQPASLPEFGPDPRRPKGPLLQATPGESLDDALARLERELITQALAGHDFNLGRVAESLNITRHALRYRMQRLNMKLAGETGPGREEPEF